MKKQYLFFILSCISWSVIADDIDDQVDKIFKGTTGDAFFAKTFDDMFGEIDDLKDLYFKSSDPNQKQKIISVIENYLIRVRDLMQPHIVRSYGKAIESFIKGLDNLLKENEQIKKDAEIFGVLNRGKNNIQVQFVIASAPSSTPTPSTARTVRVAPQRGILTEEPGMETAEVLPMIQYTVGAVTQPPGVYEEYKGVERIIPVGTRPVAQPYTATITPATQEQLNTELRRLRIRADWLRRSMPS